MSVGISLNRKCEKCGKDEWVTVDNPTEFLLMCLMCNKIVYKKQDFVDNFICEECNCNKGQLSEDDNEIRIICDNCFHSQQVFKKPPIVMNNRDKKVYSNNVDTKAESPVQCPRCGSTQITAGARGVNGVWGFIGASKTVNRCMKCGHSWKPHK